MDKSISNLKVMSGNCICEYTFGRPKRTNRKNNKMVMSVEVSEGDTYEETYKFAEPTIYDYYPTFSRALVNKAIEKMDLLDRFFVFYIYGGNLPHPVPYQLTEGQMNYFHSTVLPKLKDILFKLPNYKRDNNSSRLEVNEFDTYDFITLRKLMGVYRRNGFDLYISCNMLYIKALEGGYLNGKKYTPNEVMQIMRLEKDEYDDLVNGIELVESNKEVSKTLEHKMGRIHNRF